MIDFMAYMRLGLFYPPLLFMVSSFSFLWYQPELFLFAFSLDLHIQGSFWFV